MFKTLSALLLFRGALALDIQITGFSCESRAVKANFTYICNNDAICSFGEQVTLEGQLNYYGVVDEWLKEDGHYMYLDSEAVVNVAGSEHVFPMFDDVQVPVCSNSMVAEDGNNYACPSDGSYGFQASYSLPTNENAFMDWVVTGWPGQIILSIYAEKNATDIMGKCYLDMTTHVTGSLESNGYFNSSKPDAKTAAILVTLFSVAFLALCAYCCCCAKKQEENDNSFARMENDGTNYMI